jgi:hypothetical protein
VKQNIELAALFSRGAIADVAEVRTLRALPETADELRALARSLDAGDDTELSAYIVPEGDIAGSCDEPMIWPITMRVEEPSTTDYLKSPENNELYK